MRLRRFDLAADLEYDLCIVCAIISDMYQNRRVPIISLPLIYFLVGMRARYPHDERASDHLEDLMDRAVRNVRLAVDVPEM